MCLKSVPFRRGFPIVSHCQRKKVKLGIGVFYAVSAANEAAAFELVRCARPGTKEQPPGRNHLLSEKVPMSKKRDWLRCGHLDINLEMVL